VINILRVMSAARRADINGMNNPLRSLPKSRCLAAVALAVAAIPFAVSPASAASHGHSHHSKPALSAAVTTTAAATPVPAATPAPSVTSVISIGGYVFYNLTYAEAVDAWAAAVAAAPAGYVAPTVYSVSVNTTVSGTVDDGNG
jgi:hypothetical protein